MEKFKTSLAALLETMDQMQAHTLELKCRVMAIEEQLPASPEAKERLIQRSREIHSEVLEMLEKTDPESAARLDRRTPDELP